MADEGPGCADWLIVVTSGLGSSVFVNIVAIGGNTNDVTDLVVENVDAGSAMEV